MKKTALIATLSASLLLTLASSALAHDHASLDKMSAPNAGQLRMAGEYHLELVLAKDGKETKESPIFVYLTDHDGKKVPSAGGSASVTILAGKNKLTSTLTPDGDNRLKGSAKYVLAPGLKAVVTYTPAGKEAVVAQFTPGTLLKAKP